MKHKITILVCLLMFMGVYIALMNTVNQSEPTLQSEILSANSPRLGMNTLEITDKAIELELDVLQQYYMDTCTDCAIGDSAEVDDNQDSTVTTTVTTTNKPVTTKPSTTTTKPVTTTTPSTTTTMPVTTTSPVTTTTAPQTTTTPQTTTSVESSVTSETTTIVTTTTASNVSSMAEQIIKIINEERAKNNKTAYILDAELCAIANQRAKELATKFSHTRPNGSNYSSALDENGYSYKVAGENIAYGYADATAVMAKWMSSTPHRNNILDNNKVGYTTIGIGYYYANGRPYYVQMFVK